ncbi:MAG: ADOP family duplicated permease [Gemmatimonadales bacterium]
MTEPRNPSRSWRRLFRRARPDVPTDVDDELGFHLAMRTEHNRALGMSDDEARARAEMRLGDLETVRSELIRHDHHREAAMRRTDYVRDLIQDIRFGLRALRRAPAFTAAAVATLALGIGANSAIFSVMNAVVLRPLPYARPDRLVSIGNGSAGEYQALVRRLHAFESIAAWVATTHPVDDGATVTRLDGAAVTVNLLPMLGVAPARGRGFARADAAAGAEHVVLVSDAFARRLGGQNVIDRFLTIEGVRCRIIGVMPADFRYPTARVDYWQPYRFDAANVGYTWAYSDKQLVARLRDGVTTDAATRDLAAVWPTIRKLNPIWDPGVRYGIGVSTRPLQDRVLGAARGYIWMLFGVVVLVLVIASVNVANLLLARATARSREFAVRAALGGSRGRLVRQLLTESAILSMLAAVLGAAVGWGALRWLVASLPGDVPRIRDIGFDGSVVAYTAVVSLVTGLAFGLVPAWRATAPFRSGGGAGGFGRGLTRGASHARVASALICTEVALAVVLVSASALLLRSFSDLANVKPGFDPAHVVAARITVPETEHRAERTDQLYDAVLDQVAAVRGVKRVAAVDQLPMAQSVWGFAVRVAGLYEDATHELPEINHLQSITPEYFDVMGIPLLRGRAFTVADREGVPAVAVISESVAQRFWPGQDPLGKRIGYPYPSEWLTVVGVVPDTKQDSLSEARSTSVYVPWRQRANKAGGELWIVARTTGDAAGLAPALRAIVRAQDRSVAVGELRTMSTVLASSLGTARFVTTLVTAFALLALLLGTIGIYGVMSYTVSERMPEMGIRLALGATRANIVRLIVGRAVALSAVGAGVGLVLLFAARRGLAPWLFGVTADNWVAIIAVPALFVGVAVAASLTPALRGSRGDVTAVLKA